MTFTFRQFRPCAALLLICVFAARGGLPAQRRNHNRPLRAEAARLRQRAVTVLLETAEAARSFDDPFYRARVQASVADALWPFDETAARAIFRRAWVSAIAADYAEQEAAEGESGVPAPTVTDARDEVLAKAARHPHLADQFLQEMLAADQKREGQGEGRMTDGTPWREVSAGGIRRLALAYELLSAGQHARASETIAPVVQEGVSADLIALLLYLRDQNARLADMHFRRLLEVARADTERTDANAILLLSSYIISPQLLVVVDEGGALQFRSVARTATDTASDPVASEVRAAFYDTAAAALLRRPLKTGASGSAPAEMARYYYAVERLLPFFEREAPQHAAGLRAARDALLSEVDAGRREALSGQRELRSLTERSADLLRPQLDALGRARDRAERDRLRVAVVKTAARHKLWERARMIAAEIEDEGIERAALSFIAVNQIESISQAYAETVTDDFERAAQFVRGADVPPLARAWGLAQAAGMAARRGKHARAVELLDEAVSFAGRTEKGTRQRVAAFAAVTEAAARLVDAARAWELLPAVVGAVNEVEDFAGDEASLDIVADTVTALEGEDVELSIDVEAFRLDKVFATMAHLDFARALGEARLLAGVVPRAFASVAVARSVLERDGGGQRDHKVVLKHSRSSLQ